jgi:hypothetical protein
MSDTVAIAKWLRELAKEALAAARLDALGEPLAGELRTERRGDAFAASVELDDDYDTAAAALVAQFGSAERAGVDPHGVRWTAYRPAQSFGLVILVEEDGVAVLHLEPFGRGKFTGLEPDVAAWFAARRASTSRPAAEVAAEYDAKRAARKASAKPGRGGRLTAARIEELAGWFRTLGEAPLDRAAIDRFAAAHELLLDDDDAFAGRTYLAPRLGVRVLVHAAFVHVMVILAESDGESGEEDALKAAAHAKRHAALRRDVIAALGDPAAEGERTYISTERWAVWRAPHAMIALVSGTDPRGDGGHATALRLVAWPPERDLPGFETGAVAWIDAQLPRPRSTGR